MLEPGDEDLGRRFKFEIRLVDHGGQAVSDGNGVDIAAHMELDVEPEQIDVRVPGLTPIILGLDRGLPLEPGIYRWEVTATDFPETSWHRSFQVLEPGFEISQP